jgi:hypothetical protein
VVLLVAALLVAGAIVWGCAKIADEMRAARTDARRDRTLAILRIFASVGEDAAADPRSVLTWEPLARAARRLFPDAFTELDTATGTAFPLAPERIEAAHGHWTADWLAWERAHDAEYKTRAAALEHEIAKTEGSDGARARLDLLEREKLDVYQRRYQEYVRVAKALQALTKTG